MLIVLLIQTDHESSFQHPVFGTTKDARNTKSRRFIPRVFKISHTKWYQPIEWLLSRVFTEIIMLQTDQSEFVKSLLVLPMSVTATHGYLCKPRKCERRASSIQVALLLQTNQRRQTKAESWCLISESIALTQSFLRGLQVACCCCCLHISHRRYKQWIQLPDQKKAKCLNPAFLLKVTRGRYLWLCTPHLSSLSSKHNRNSP